MPVGRRGRKDKNLGTHACERARSEGNRQLNQDRHARMRAYPGIFRRRENER